MVNTRTIQSDYKMLNIDNYSEYLCNLKVDDLVYQENNTNGNYHLVPNVPLNLMPPPPHNIANNNFTIHHYNRRGSWKSRGEVRSNSPNGSESDESCRSYVSHESPAETKRPNQNFNKESSSLVTNTFLYNNNRYNNNNARYTNNRHSNKSTNVFYNTQYQSNAQYQNNHKTRYLTSNTQQRRESNKRPLNIYKRVYGLMER
ncbi:hypothetical protein QE152_g37577 [Popillia japonica]|uniref:Uncharacterized protein n=1 Tax=Popillia japonica TaxID=7064 RepID=A0AAW1IAE6_POPJA